MFKVELKKYFKARNGKELIYSFTEEFENENEAQMFYWLIEKDWEKILTCELDDYQVTISLTDPNGKELEWFSDDGKIER